MRNLQARTVIGVVYTPATFVITFFRAILVLYPDRVLFHQNKSINFIILTLCSGSGVSKPAQSEAVQPVVLGDHLRLHGGHGGNLSSAPHHCWHLSWRVEVISLSRNHLTLTLFQPGWGRSALTPRKRVYPQKINGWKF